MLPSVQSVFDKTPANIRSWATSRRPDAKAADLIRCCKTEAAKGRRVEVCLESLPAGFYVAHPEFMNSQRGKDRACDDCTASGWNQTVWSPEKLQLPKCEDVVDYASRLLRHDHRSSPRLAVADEQEA